VGKKDQPSQLRRFTALANSRRPAPPLLPLVRWRPVVCLVEEDGFLVRRIGFGDHVDELGDVELVESASSGEGGDRVADLEGVRATMGVKGGE